MKRIRIMKRVLAFALSAVMTVTGLQFPAVSALAVESRGADVQGNLSLPLELYDYQSDGLLFQYDLSDNWALTNAVVNGEFWSVLSAAARAELAGTHIQANAAGTASIIEGLVEGTDNNGLTYKAGTYELLAWYLMESISNVDPTFPMVDEENATFTWNGVVYDWNYADYEKYSVYFTEDTDPDTLSDTERAYYEMYYRDYYTYDNESGDNIRLCKMYFEYYTAKVQWKFANHLKTQAETLTASAGTDEEAAKTLLGIIKSAIDDYNSYKTNEAVIGADVADICKIDTSLQYYYGADNGELDALGYVHVPLTGGLPGENDEGYLADIQYVKTLSTANPQLWAELLTIIELEGKGRVLTTVDDRILSTEDSVDAEGNPVVANITWDTYYSVENFVPGFDYIYRHMAYEVTDSALLNGFANWYTTTIDTKAESYTTSYDLMDTTVYNVNWRMTDRLLQLGAGTHSGPVGAKRTFSLEPGTYTVEWSIKQSSCNILLTDSQGNALSGFDHVESPVGVGHTASFTLTEADDITVLLYYNQENNWTDIYDFRIKNSLGEYITRNGVYGEFYDSGAQYRWKAVIDEADGDGVYPGTYDKEVRFEGITDAVSIPASGHQNGDFYMFRPLKINGREEGAINLTMKVEAGKEYVISYGQAAYNVSDVLITDTTVGTMQAILSGAALVDGTMDVANGVTQGTGAEGEIVTDFAASSYNVDGIHDNRPGYGNDDGVTVYHFVPEGDTVTLTFKAVAAEGRDYYGWVSGLHVSLADGTQTILDTPTKAESYESMEGWVSILNGSTEGVSVNVSAIYQDSVGVIENPVTAGANQDFVLPDDLSVLEINGDNGGDRLYSQYVDMGLREEYIISYDTLMTSITELGSSMLGNIVTDDGALVIELPIRKGTNISEKSIGNYAITQVVDNGDGTWWVTLSCTFTAFWERARISLPDTAGDFTIRNLSLVPAANKAYELGDMTEAQAAAAYAQANGTAGSGIRNLVDLFVDYHANAGDANGMTAYDYVYYMLTYLFDNSSVAAKKINAYDNLVLAPVTNEITTVTSKKTGESFDVATYGFYATGVANQTDADGNVIERNQAFVALNPKSDENATGTISNDFTATSGQIQLFPLNGMGYEAPVDNSLYYGNNYNYVMHSGGRFVYHAADNLVFMFTGDDDVYLYLNHRLALDLGGAHTAYSDYVFVNDVAEELGLEEGGVYNFDFYYMERHTTESELKVVTNINVLDAEAILTKGASGAYYALAAGDGTDVNAGIETAASAMNWEKIGSDTVDADRKNIPSGSAVPEGQKMYYLQLTGGELPLDEIRFDDDMLGVHIGAALYGGYFEDTKLQLSEPEITLNAETALTDLRISITSQEGVERIVHQLTGEDCACGETGLTEDAYKTHLLEDVFGEGAGIEENETLKVDGIRHTVTTGITNVGTAQALIRDYETAKDNGIIASDTSEFLEVNRAYHSMDVDENYYVEGNAENHEDGYVLMDILANEDFNGKSYSELSAEERAALTFRAYDEDGNIISEDVTNLDGTVTKAVVLFDAETGTIRFRPEDLTAEGSSDAYTTTIYYDFDSTLTINGILYASNPVPVTLNVYVLQNDVYVLDYGLGVSLTGGNGDMFANDKYDVAEAEGDTLEETNTKRDRAETYLGISNGAVDAEGNLTYVTKGEIAGTDGILTTDQALIFNLKSYAKDGQLISVQYQPNGFMDSIEQFVYGVEVKDNADAVITAKQDTGIRMTGNITVMPATVVYYEDNFTGIVTGSTEAVTEKTNLITGAITGIEDGAWKTYVNGVVSFGDDYSQPMEIGEITGGADWDAYLQYRDSGLFNNLEMGKTYTITASVYSSIARTIVVASDNARDFYQTVDLNPGMNYIAVPYTKLNTDSQNGQLLTFFLGNPNQTGNMAPAYYSAENPLAAHTLMIQDVAMTEERLQENVLDTQYGYDTSYGNDDTYSNDSYTVMNGTDKLAFTFKGTGFDLLARATDVTASVRVTVYDAAQVGLKSYTVENNGQYETRVSIVRREGVESADILKQALVNTYYENGTVYQVPVISMTMDSYGEYVVVAQYVGTATDADNTKALYMDGVRIYNPLGTEGTLKEEADNTGYLTEEQDAQTTEIREMVLGSTYDYDYVDPADPADSKASAAASLVKIEDNGKFNISYGQTVVEGFTGHVTSADIAQAGSPVSTDSLLSYAVNGPSNELYLTDGAAGYAWGTVITADADAQNPAVQIGLKAVAGTPVVSYMNKDGGWTALEGLGDNGTLVTATERYYRIPVLEELYQVNGKAVLLIKAEGGIVSLTTLKHSQVTFAPVTSLGDDAVVYDAAKTPFSILSKGSSARTTTLTFSVKSTITDFTIQGGENISFTYDGEQTLPEGVKVSVRGTGDMSIYVVKMPYQAGDYTITTADGAGYSAVTFTVE